MKILAIGGEPATGKTSLMRALMFNLPDLKLFKYGLVTGHESEKYKIRILGRYDQATVFGGTDRLSMAVQPEAVRFVDYTLGFQPDYNLVFEGDRLFNGKFLKVIQEKVTDHKLVVLQSDANQKTARHIERRDSQTATFIKGRMTKYKNLIAEFPKIETWSNNSHLEMARCLRSISDYLSIP